jgi:hypothetical protein
VGVDTVVRIEGNVVSPRSGEFGGTSEQTVKMWKRAGQRTDFDSPAHVLVCSSAISSIE